jgi:hypothetical protein
MLRRRRHGGDGKQGIVGRRLQSFAQGLVGTAAIEVQNAEGVGDEKAVNFPRSSVLASSIQKDSSL